MLIHSSLLSIALLIVIAIFFVVVADALMTVKVQVTLNVVNLLLIRIQNWLNVRREHSWWKLRWNRRHSHPDSRGMLRLMVVSVGWQCRGVTFRPFLAAARGHGERRLLHHGIEALVGHWNVVKALSDGCAYSLGWRIGQILLELVGGLLVGVS